MVGGEGIICEERWTGFQTTGWGEKGWAVRPDACVRTPGYNQSPQPHAVSICSNAVFVLPPALRPSCYAAIAHGSVYVKGRLRSRDKVRPAAASILITQSRS